MSDPDPVTITTVEYAYLCTLRGPASHYLAVNEADRQFEELLKSMDAPPGVYNRLRPHLRGAMTVLFLDAGGIRRSAYDADGLSVDTSTDASVARAVVAPLHQHGVSKDLVDTLFADIKEYAAAVRRAGDDYRQKGEIRSSRQEQERDARLREHKARVDDRSRPIPDRTHGPPGRRR